MKNKIKKRWSVQIPTHGITLNNVPALSQSEAVIRAMAYIAVLMGTGERPAIIFDKARFDVENRLENEYIPQCKECGEIAAFSNSVSGHDKGHDIDLDVYECSNCGNSWAD